MASSSVLLQVLRTPPQALLSILRAPSEAPGQVELIHDIHAKRIPEEKLREIDLVSLFMHHITFAKLKNWMCTAGAPRLVKQVFFDSILMY